MEFLFFILCSIVLARLVEKKSKIISVTHAILFIILLTTYFLTSKNEIFVNLGKRLFGEGIYTIIHESFTDNTALLFSGLTVLLISQIILVLITSILAMREFIVEINKSLKRLKLRNKLASIKLAEILVKRGDENVASTKNNNLIYLVLGQLRN